MWRSDTPRNRIFFAHFLYDSELLPWCGIITDSMLEQHHQKVGYADLDPRVNGAMVISEDRMHSQEFKFTLQTTRS